MYTDEKLQKQLKEAQSQLQSAVNFLDYVEDADDEVYDSEYKTAIKNRTDAVSAFAPLVKYFQVNEDVKKSILNFETSLDRGLTINFLLKENLSDDIVEYFITN